EASLLVSDPRTGAVALMSPPQSALMNDDAAAQPAVATAGVRDVRDAIDDPEPAITGRPRPIRSETLPAILRSPVAPERERPAPPAPAPAAPDVALPAVGEAAAPPVAAINPAPSPAVPPSTPPPPSRAAAPAAALPVNTPAPAPTMPAADDESLVKQTLQRYRHAYDGLDARSAHAVWPSVD